MKVSKPKRQSLPRPTWTMRRGNVTMNSYATDEVVETTLAMLDRLIALDRKRGRTS